MDTLKEFGVVSNSPRTIIQLIEMIEWSIVDCRDLGITADSHIPIKTFQQWPIFISLCSMVRDVVLWRKFSKQHAGSVQQQPAVTFLLQVHEVLGAFFKIYLLIDHTVLDNLSAFKLNRY
ncbi:hypothetical protein D3C87_957580 [compost metagenome]